MDNQKDFYIKSRFKEDDLISKKADEIFNNFFMEEIKMEEEKVVNINTAKDKKTKKRRFASLVATLLVVFLGANVYATSQGYDNIFFMINTIFTGEKITDRDEILKDRDITISYQPIKITENLNFQINRLIVEEESATLYVRIEETYPLEMESYKCLIYDVTNDKKLVGEYRRPENTDDTGNIGLQTTEQINLNGLKNDTSKLQIEVVNQDNEIIATVKVDLENKKIDVLNGENVALEKISETELKQVLGLYALLNLANDWNAPAKDEAYKASMLEIALLAIIEKEGEWRDEYDLAEVKASMKEFSGEELEKPYSVGICVYDAKNKKYKFEAGELYSPGLCLEISDISFENGIYTVTFKYCYPGEDYNIEELDRYETTMKLSINEQYEYNKYRVENLKTLTSKKISSGSDNFAEVEDVYEDTNEIIAVEDVDKVTEEVVENEITAIEDESVIEKIDNYASTMSWSPLYVPGLKARVPSSWNVTVHDDYYDESKSNDTVATIVSGVATGKNPETNEIVKSNVELIFYMPEFVGFTNYDDYADYIAEKCDGENAGSGYCDENGNMKWGLVIGGDGREYYCNLEVMPEGESIGRIIEVKADNSENYKVINILNWIFTDLKYASF